MSNQSRGRKKSQFVAQSTIAGSDRLDFVTGSTNRSITFTDFLSQLGTTGTLAQQGNVLGTPVLNTSGSVNNIRNLEDGAGVKSSLSPEGGITLAHNFTQDTVGTPILVNPANLSPAIASLEAGNGIAIVAVDNHIEISTSAVAVSTKTIIINEISDFPAAVAGVITLLDDREYLLTNDINLGTDRLVMGDNTAVKGTESILITLTYTGTGDMFTMIDQTNRISNMSISCANGRIINWSSTSLKIFRMNDVSITSCDRFGLFNAVDGILRFTNVSPAAIATDGLEFQGDYRSFLYEVSASTISGGALFNLGTATFDSFIATTVLATLNAGTNLLSGVAASANINAGGTGQVDTMRINGAGTPLSTINPDDALWVFLHNDDIRDTRPDALISLQSNATATVIAGAGTPVLVAGTWTLEGDSQFTSTTGGRMTYNGGKDVRLPMMFSCTVNPVSGGSVSISTEVAINGTVVPNSKRTANASPAAAASITMPWQETLSPTDFVEVFVTNEDSTVDILVSSATGRVN